MAERFERYCCTLRPTFGYVMIVVLILHAEVAPCFRSGGIETTNVLVFDDVSVQAQSVVLSCIMRTPAFLSSIIVAL